MGFRLLSPFLTYLLFYLNFLHTESATTSGNETDRIALLAFKDQITNDPRGSLSSWNNSLPFCEWKGVICSRRHRQRITILNLEGQKLLGSLSPSLGNLTFLHSINLADNNIHGKIPIEIGRLSRLQYLNLSKNSLTGEIPNNLTHCVDLKIINFILNELVGRIPLGITSLPKLQRLRLAGNNLTGSIPPSLGNISSLKELSLARNNLVGSIPAELGRLKNLTFFQITQNELSGSIPPSLYNLSSLSLFSVADNHLHGTLPHNIGLLFPELEMFYVGTNRFTGSIPVSIINCSKLVELFFTYNRFSGSVPENLGSLSNLLKLNLGGNQLGGTKVNDLSFLNSLTNCTRLEILDIHLNQFGGELPHSIANLSTHLQALATGGNEIYGKIPPGFDNLVNLNLLGLEFNLFTGTIPAAIGSLQKMKILDLRGNKLTGQIPASLGNLSLLYTLYLGGNDLSGTLPSSLGHCQNLQILQLSRNKLQGVIPRQIMNLSSLTIFLDLSHNSLEGPLPLEVGSLKHLGRLDVSENKLSGEIPQTLGSCESLINLNLKSNFFYGVIPASLSNLRGIQEIDLSSNNLSGKIPRYLEKLLFVEKLNLSFNNLEGEVPEDGIFRNMSAISVVGNSKLCGGIPKLKLPRCHIEESKRKKDFALLKVIMPIAIVGLCLILSVFIFGIFYCKRKYSYTSSMEDTDLKVSYRGLLKSTDGFSTANLIGKGSYGSVYKAILDQDKTVAVKVLDIKKRGATKNFMAECKALRNIRHRNLIKLLNLCSSLDFKGNEFKALVYEFMPNGNLDGWLHPPREDDQHGCRKLNIVERLNIAIDVASALDYLHNHCQTPIVHCDLKPSNVLLDDDMTAHVGDFGLARFLNEIVGDSFQSTTSVGIKGTIGYVPPGCAVALYNNST